ncbi:MAG: hypothetical protein K0R46_2734, partial [Herbinix sp.]|nr:hypothetical protein [Herbinix sp.]
MHIYTSGLAFPSCGIKRPQSAGLRHLHTYAHIFTGLHFGCFMTSKPYIVFLRFRREEKFCSSKRKMKRLHPVRI